jgi:tellurite resistance protein TehA-like permease
MATLIPFNMTISRLIKEIRKNRSSARLRGQRAVRDHEGQGRDAFVHGDLFTGRVPAGRGARILLDTGMTVLGVVMAAVLLAAAGYAQYRIPAHTASPANAWLVRAVLALVGVALGYVGSLYAQDAAGALVAFLAGFGVVHFPAAVILFVKRARGTGKS